MREDRDEWVVAGVGDYLSKPVCMQELKAALERTETAIEA